MTILLRLHNPTLQFVQLSKGRIHARWNAQSHYVNHRKHTMCGRPITNEMKPLSEREIDVRRICGNCYSSLRTYGPQVELVESEAVG